VLSEKFPEHVIRVCKALKPFNDYLNEVVGSRAPVERVK
jgi:hypothetical protein